MCLLYSQAADWHYCTFARHVRKCLCQDHSVTCIAWSYIHLWAQYRSALRTLQALDKELRCRTCRPSVILPNVVCWPQIIVPRSFIVAGYSLTFVNVTWLDWCKCLKVHNEENCSVCFCKFKVCDFWMPLLFDGECVFFVNRAKSNCLTEYLLLLCIGIGITNSLILADPGDYAVSPKWLSLNLAAGCYHYVRQSLVTSQPQSITTAQILLLDDRGMCLAWEQLAQSRYMKVEWPGVETAISWVQVQML